jgi:hypothetical protein
MCPDIKSPPTDKVLQIIMRVSRKQNHKTTALMSTFLSEINHIPFKLFGGAIKDTE